MIGNNVKEARERKGLSQLELAYLTKIAPSNISAIEAEKIFLYPGWRKRIAVALNIPEEELTALSKEVI